MDTIFGNISAQRNICEPPRAKGREGEIKKNDFYDWYDSRVFLFR